MLSIKDHIKKIDVITLVHWCFTVQTLFTLPNVTISFHMANRFTEHFYYCIIVTFLKIVLVVPILLQEISSHGYFYTTTRSAKRFAPPSSIGRTRPCDYSHRLEVTVNWLYSYLFESLFPMPWVWLKLYCASPRVRNKSETERGPEHSCRINTQVS